MRARWWIYFASLIICAATLVWAAISGPDPFPTHWGAGGVADSFSPLSAAVAILTGVGLGIGALLGLFAAAVSKLPNSLINTPHAEFWLTPEQRPRLDDYLQKYLVMTAVGVMLLLSLSITITILAPEKSPVLGWSVWIFVAIQLLATVHLVWRLARPPVSNRG